MLTRPNYDLVNFGVKYGGPVPIARSDNGPPPPPTVEDNPELLQPLDSDYEEYTRMYNMRWRDWYAAGNKFYLSDPVILSAVYIFKG